MSVLQNTFGGHGIACCPNVSAFQIIREFYIIWFPRVKGVLSMTALLRVECITAVQVALRWQIQRGVAVVPKSNSLSHQRENISVSNS